MSDTIHKLTALRRPRLLIETARPVWRVTVPAPRRKRSCPTPVCGRMTR